MPVFAGFERPDIDFEQGAARGLADNVFAELGGRLKEGDLDSGRTAIGRLPDGIDRPYIAGAEPFARDVCRGMEACRCLSMRRLDQAIRS